jgi:hypothetical protein
MGLGEKGLYSGNSQKSALERMESKLHRRNLFSVLAAFFLATAIAVPIGVNSINQAALEEQQRNEALAIQQENEARVAFESDRKIWEKIIKQCRSKFARIDTKTRSLMFLPLPTNPGVSWLTEQSDCIKFNLTGNLDPEVEEGSGPKVTIYWSQEWNEADVKELQKTNFPLAIKYFAALNKCDSWVTERQYARDGGDESLDIDQWENENSYDSNKLYNVRSMRILNLGFNSKKSRDLRCIGKSILGEETFNRVMTEGDSGQTVIKKDFEGMTFQAQYGREEDREWLIIDRTLVDGVQRFD